MADFPPPERGVRLSFWHYVLWQREKFLSFRESVPPSRGKFPPSSDSAPPQTEVGLPSPVSAGPSPQLGRPSSDSAPPSSDSVLPSRQSVLPFTECIGRKSKAFYRPGISFYRRTECRHRPPICRDDGAECFYGSYKAPYCGGVAVEGGASSVLPSSYAITAQKPSPITALPPTQKRDLTPGGLPPQAAENAKKRRQKSEVECQ